MHKHITHFDDCGCLSQRKDAEIAALTALCLELAGALKKVLEADHSMSGGVYDRARALLARLEAKR